MSDHPIDKPSNIPSHPATPDHHQHDTNHEQDHDHDVHPFIAFTIALLTATVAHRLLPVAMGCFSSKPTHPDSPISPTTTTAAATANTSVNAPPPRKLQHVVTDPTAAGIDASGQVLSVPRSTVNIGDRERAQLKLKNLRDTLEVSITKSETLLKDEGRLAVELKRSGNPVSARILVRRRKALKDRIQKAEIMLEKVSELIHSVEIAIDNNKLINALDSGAKAIHEIHNQVSIDTAQSALADHRQAIAYAQQVNDVIGQEAGEVGEEEYEETMKWLEEQDEEYVEKQESGKVDDHMFPQVPNTVPQQLQQQQQMEQRVPIAQ